jgi:hypothetical protein
MENKMSEENSVVLTGEEQIKNGRLLAIRSALRLETKGLTRRGLSARQLAIRELGLKPSMRTEAVYKALNAHIVSILGDKFDMPLTQKTPTDHVGEDGE